MKKCGKIPFLQSNRGYTLIELIVSMLVSSMVLLAVVLFFSVALKQYRETAVKTELMTESQVAVSRIREVMREAVQRMENGSYECMGNEYDWLMVRTNQNYHLFVLDQKENQLLYYAEDGSGPLSAEFCMNENLLVSGTVSETAKKQYFLAAYVNDFSVDCSNAQLIHLTLRFQNAEQHYVAEETIYLRNSMPTPTTLPGG